MWVTAIVTMLFLCGIDSIVDNGYTLIWLTITGILLYISYKTINEEEFNIISGNNWMTKIFGEDNDTDIDDKF